MTLAIVLAFSDIFFVHPVGAVDVKTSSAQSGIYEDDSALLTYVGTNWQTASSTQDSGGTSALTSRAGSVRLDFYGTGVSWQSRRTPSSGINDVYIDGVLHTSVDRYSAATAYRQTVFSVSGLERADHVIEIRWTGAKNAAATGSNLLVDAFVVLDDEPPAPPSGLTAVAVGSGAQLSWEPVTSESVTYAVSLLTADGPTKVASGLTSTQFSAHGYRGGEQLTFAVSSIDSSGNESALSSSTSLVTLASAQVGRYDDKSPYVNYSGSSWQTSASSQDLAGSSQYTARAGVASFTFEGTGVRWVSRTGPTSGVNAVTLDGVRQPLVDRYSSAMRYQQIVFEASGLDYAMHTLTVEWTGQKNASSTGDNLLVDGFEVTGASAAAAPTGLSAQPGNGGMQLSWAAAVNATSYTVSRSHDSGTTWQDLAAGSTESTALFDGALPGGRDYLYRVSSIDQWGNRSEPSDSVQATAEPSPGVGRYENNDPRLAYAGSNWTVAASGSDSGGSSATTTRSGSVRFAFDGTAIQLLSRQSATSGIARVRIDDGDPVEVDRYSASTMYQQVVFERRDLEPGTHVIEVEWTNAANPLATSNSLVVDAFIVADTTPPPAPASLTIAQKGSGLVASWSASDAPDVAGYRLLRGTDSAPIEIARVGAGSTSFEDAPLTTGTTYTYLVTAVDQSGNVSSASPAAQGTPTSPPGVGLYQDDSEFVTYRGASWQSQSAFSDSGGTVRYTTRSGSASFTFAGTAIAWISRLSPSSGVANVYIDGTLMATVDRYSATNGYGQVVYENRGLTDDIHTIEVAWTGQKNSSATGSNLIVDAFRVIDVVAPSPPTGVTASVVRQGISIVWNAGGEGDLAGYRLYQALGSGAFQDVSGLITEPSFTDVGVPFSALAKYYVTAVDTSGNESPRSVIRAVNSAGPPNIPEVRFDDCPGATITVRSAAELRAALTAARPGDVIRLVSGVYAGSFTLTASGTAIAPIWICGPRDAVINGGSVSTGQGLFIGGGSHLRVTGFSVTNTLKGLTIVGGDDVAASDISFSNIGYEAIHVRGGATNTAIVGNVIRTTGRLDPSFGEGIYIGSSKENWCALSACAADQVRGALVALNNIAFAGAQPIEAKEGTSDGLIYKNRVDGAKGADNSNAWILVKGNDWVVDSNVGTTASGNGYAVIATGTEWGLRNVFTRNSASGPASGFGIWLHKPTLGTLVGCENTSTQFASGLTNFGCQR